MVKTRKYFVVYCFYSHRQKFFFNKFSFLWLQDLTRQLKLNPGFKLL